ncbi:MAG: hypothetical protein K0S09_1646 [Sphingobacteriaceae bacterium]|nr:hypothetical protein [Sphingobacteriaceae bacterium]
MSLGVKPVFFEKNEEKGKGTRHGFGHGCGGIFKKRKGQPARNSFTGSLQEPLRIYPKICSISLQPVRSEVH